jgi:hypothetical protein
MFENFHMIFQSLSRREGGGVLQSLSRRERGGVLRAIFLLARHCFLGNGVAPSHVLKSISPFLSRVE